MPKSYPHSVRRQISHRLRSGDAVADIATETGISAATFFRWKDQALIDRHLLPLLPLHPAYSRYTPHWIVASHESAVI
ncbi:hypothetical protein LQL77_31355, partial [Rhodococcus cerastii]|nr:hypothetical protein [Rhodococcus cerastii]